MSAGALTVPASAVAAQVVVDDDRAQCPSAAHTTIAAGIAAASPGDTVSVCDGTYREGAGGHGSTALRIDKPIKLRGAGAGRTFVAAAAGQDRRIAADTPNLRDAAGNVISVIGTRADISGLTVFGDEIHLEAAIGYVDAEGVVSSVELVDLVQSTGSGALGAVDAGVGVVATGPDPSLNSVELHDSIIEGYNTAAVILDAIKADGTPQATATGVFGLVTGTRITGAGRQDVLAAQDGVRLLNGASAVIVENTIADNSRAGVYAITRSTSQTRVNLNNLQGNTFGVFSQPLSGTTRIDAVQSYWGSPEGPTRDDEPPGSKGDRVNGIQGTLGGNPLVNTSTFVDYRDFRTRPAPTTAPLSEYDDAAPSVALTAPADGAELERGVATTITADASDDVGVHGVTFRRGTTVLGTDTVAPYEATYTPSEDQAGTSQAIVAVASDSAGQTGVDARSVRIKAAAVEPPVVEDRPPTVSINPPGPYALRGTRVTVSATASDDRGVASVAIYLNDRLICTDTTAPYSCSVQARGDEVGPNALIVIATDTAGQTASAIGRLTVPKFTATSVSHSTRTRRPRKLTTSGRVALPSTVTRAQGCGAGDVRITVKRGTRTVRKLVRKLSKTCTYSASYSVSRAGRHTVAVRFLGNPVLNARSARTRRVTVR